jgi:hypothetical protein
LQFWFIVAILIAPIDSDTNGNVTDEIPIGTQVPLTMGVTVDDDSNLTPNNIKVSDSLSAELELGEAEPSIINSQTKGVVSWHLFRETIREGRITIITV